MVGETHTRGRNALSPPLRIKKMKKIIMLITAMVTMFSFCGGNTPSFEFVNSDNGYSYIQINENLDAFSFKSDWHSLGNAGRVGYVVYTSDMSESERAAYMEANANNPEFQKSVNGGVIDLGSLKSGDRVGFYEVRPNGRTYTHSSFEEWKGETWLAFDKNGGHGKDEWMTIEDVSTSTSGGGSGGGTPNAPNGAPLPGLIPTLACGLFGFTMFAGRKVKNNKTA